MKEVKGSKIARPKCKVLTLKRVVAPNRSLSSSRKETRELLQSI